MTTILHSRHANDLPSCGLNPLCHHSACGGALVLPVRLQDTDCLVVSAEAVDSGFDQDEAELGVLVLAVALEVLADGDSLS